MKLGVMAAAFKKQTEKQDKASPTGKPLWSGAAIDDILSNDKYAPHIISEDRFWKVQFEKDRRSNMMTTEQESPSGTTRRTY